MKKIILLSLTYVMTLNAWALQPSTETEIGNISVILDAVLFTQNSSTSLYMLANSPEVTVGKGSIAIDGTTYNLNSSDVVTEFVNSQAPDINGTDNEQIEANTSVERNYKLLRNGHLVIVKGGKMYNALGMKY